MKILIFTCLLALLCGARALPNIAPNAQKCGNGISCAPSQTCMSNSTGAGLVYACSPLPNAVRCNDARFSCPASFTCGEELKCKSADGTHEVDYIANVDAFETEEMRDFGNGMTLASLDICFAIQNNFRLPNFCRCASSRIGGQLSCNVGVSTYLNVGAAAWILPCGSPASVGYQFWVQALGQTHSVGRSWTASFTFIAPIPYANFHIGVASVGANAELSADISNFILSTRMAVGVCATVNLGFFSHQTCNPSSLPWLPVTILTGPRVDFSRFCR